MKKLIVVLALVVSALVASAAGEMDYVVVGNKTYFSDNIKVGLNNLRIENADGLIVKAPLKKVDAYMVDGILCERLPLIAMDGKEKCTAILEMVAFRNGLRLYKLRANEYTRQFGCCFMNHVNKASIYLVYKNDQLYLRVNETNAETVFEFFDVHYTNAT